MYAEKLRTVIDGKNFLRLIGTCTLTGFLLAEALSNSCFLMSTYSSTAVRYDKTVLGERGVTVSGGQKQRISIARALLKNAPILILDDSVSAVDTKTENNIMENLREHRRGKTTILIAHRVSTITKMDKLLFIEEGRLEAVGSHEELYRTCPAYRRMVDMQKLEEEGGEQNV